MAASSRIAYPTNTIGGGPLHLAVYYSFLAQQQFVLAKAIADSVTGGGVAPANMEGTAEFNLPAGTGAAVYALLQSAVANANTLVGSTSVGLVTVYVGP